MQHKRFVREKSVMENVMDALTYDEQHMLSQSALTHKLQRRCRQKRIPANYCKLIAYTMRMYCE